MDNIFIKICGISDPCLAKSTAEAGAHFIGIVFHPLSKRYVHTMENAKLISQTVKNAHAIPVAVFVDHNAKQMQEICKTTDIQVIQLHGNISRSQHHLLPSDYQRIFVQSVWDNIENEIQYCSVERDFLLFDHPNAGGGQCFNWKLFQHKTPFRYFVAGGLTADNVQMAIQTLKPTGVDVSTGVENKQGIKDIISIKSFIKKVRDKK